MNGVSTSVIFVTKHYDLYCNVCTRSVRLLDAFNDSSTRYLELDNVRYCRPEGEEPVLELPKALLVKDNIHLAILVSEDRRNESKVFFATLERRTMQATVALPNVLVTGQIHAKGANDPQGYLTFEAGMYFPVTSAIVVGRPDLTPSPGAVVMVNKSSVVTLALERS